MDLFLSICLAVLAFSTAFVQFFYNRYNKGKADKDKKDSSLPLIIIAFAILSVASLKSVRDFSSKGRLKDANDSLQKTLIRLDAANDRISDKLIQIDTLTNYIKRIEKIGIKRDTVSNQPIITSKFYNRIDRVENLNQY